MGKCSCNKPGCVNCLMDGASQPEVIPEFSVHPNTVAVVIVVRPNEYLSEDQKKSMPMTMADIVKLMKTLNFLLEPQGVSFTVSTREKS